MSRVSAVVGRTVRSVKALVKDPEVPRPLRWLLALSLLPIPGPLDEAVLVLLAPLFVALYRRPMLKAWRDAAGSGADEPAGRAR